MIAPALFFMALFLIGFFFIAFGISILMKYKGMSNWETANGEITYIKYMGTWYPVGEALTIKDEFEICYEFSINGEIIQATRISPKETKIMDRNTGFMSNGFYAFYIQDFYNSIISNPKVIVWVNPRREQDSILINNIVPYIGNIYIGFVLILWSLGMAKFVFELGNIDITTKIEVIEEKSAVEKEAFDKAFWLYAK